MKQVIHIAGTPIAIGSVHRQLCAWCGATLIDDDLSRMMVAPGCDAAAKPFEVGALVRVAGNARIVESVLGDGPIPLTDLPVGWCGHPPNVVQLKGVRG